MASGTHGFGGISFPGEVIPDAMPPPDLETQQQQLQRGLDDVHRIAEKYDGQPVEDITIFDLAPGTAKKLDFTTTPFSSIVVSVTTGTVKVMFGDYTQQALSSVTAHMQVPSGSAPFQPLLATLPRIVTLMNDPGAAVNALGCLIISRP